MPYLPDSHTDQQTVDYFRHVVLPKQDVWVTEEQDKVVGFIAFNPDTVEHLYIGPAHQSKGIGSALLEKAKSSSVGSLSLWVFQENRAAREFYESRGFSLSETTDGRGNEEREPDALYRWSRED